MWIARDKEGYLFGFNHKPIRTNYDETGYYGWTIDINYIPLNDVVNMQVQMSNIMLPKELFPELTWEDEPIEVGIVPKKYIDLFIEVNEKEYEEYKKEVIQTDYQIRAEGLYG